MINIVKAEEESILGLATVIESELDLKIIEDSKKIEYDPGSELNFEKPVNLAVTTTRADF